MSATGRGVPRQRRVSSYGPIVLCADDSECIGYAIAALMKLGGHEVILGGPEDELRF